MKKLLLFTAVITSYLLSPSIAKAMHIMEGYLPVTWAIFWGLVSLVFLIISVRKMKKLTDGDSEKRLLLALAGAFVFVLSALKIPSVTGSCSHPTGLGLGVVLFGPWPMVLISSIVLLFQALLLAHGGLTTLGANLFSMGIFGPFIGFGLYKILKKSGVNKYLSVFLAAFITDLSTYVMTSIQLGLAFPAGDFTSSLIKYLTIFAVTQLPIAVAEGILTVLVYDRIMNDERVEAIIEKVY